jgi:hypothetical protein
MPTNPDDNTNQSLCGLVFSWIQRWKEDRRDRSKMGSRQIIRETRGFSVMTLGEPNWSLKWDEVTGIVAYKRDLMSIDQICFGFRIGDDEDNLRCIDEDVDGFKDVEDDITAKTDGAWPALFTDVAMPPFELCWTVLWTAPGSPPIADNPYLHMIDPDFDPPSR